MMTTPGLEIIQGQLKSSIQNHQILVSKIKADLQNNELKAQLRDLQRQITVLSEKQKGIVQSLRKDIITGKPPVASQVNLQPNLPTGMPSIAITSVPPPAAHTMSQPAHLLLQPVNQLIPAMFTTQPISPQICAMPQFVQSIGQFVTSIPQPAHLNQPILPQPANIQPSPIPILPAPPPVSFVSTAVTNIVSSVVKSEPQPAVKLEPQPVIKTQASSPLRVPQYPRIRPNLSQGNSNKSSSTSLPRRSSADDITEKIIERKPTQAEKEKMNFMSALELITKEALNEIKNKKYDRRRRTTANPLYNFEPDIRKRPSTLALSSLTGGVKRSRGRPPKHSRSSPNNSHPSTPDSTESWPGQKNGVYKNGSNEDVQDLSCSKCGMLDNLIPCDTCHRSYHIHCVEPPLPSIPEGKWSCPKCHANGKSGTWSAETLAMVHNFIANKTAKEDEKRRLQQKSKHLLEEKLMIENKTKSLNESLLQQRRRKEELLERHRLTQQSVETMKNFIKVIQAS